MRGLQISPAKMPAGVRIRAVFPTGPATEIRKRSQSVRSKQRDEAPQRAPPFAA